MPKEKATNDFLKSEVFSRIAAWAKGYAKLQQRDQLTPLLLAGGLLRILPDLQYPLTDTDKKNIREMQQVWQSYATLDDSGVTAIENETMPLSDGLRRLISTTPTNVSDLISALCSSITPASTTASPAISRILSHASAISTSHEADEISPEIFAAGAYIACLSGELDGLPGLSSYLVANRDAGEALMRKFKPKTAPEKSTEIVNLPLSDALNEALKAQDLEIDCLRSAINLGLKTGLQFAAELAVAYHEAGHGVVSAILRPSLTVTKITIVPDPQAGADGVTYYDPTSIYWERSQTQEAFQAGICVSLAGRAAQLIKFGASQIDEGASSDIDSATEMTWRGIAELGLDPEVGPVNLASLSKATNTTSGWLFDLAQRRTQETLKNAADRAERILRENWVMLEQTVSSLMEKKSIDDTAFLTAQALRTLKGHKGVRQAISQPIERSIAFAHVNGVLETGEGPVRYRQGDGIITENGGEKWPASRDYIQENYAPSNGTEFGCDGIYTKIARTVHALQLSEVSRIDLQDWKGILTGSPGDWIVEYRTGDLAIVSKVDFEELYRLI